MFYSAKNNQWYDPSFRSDYEKKGAWPDDAKEYPREVFDEVVTFRDPNKIMAPDKNGDPTVIDRAAPTADQLWLDYQSQAQSALDKTDKVALRCWKAGVPYPADWQAYTSDLRDIVRATSGDPTKPLPKQPDYPQGT